MGIRTSPRMHSRKPGDEDREERSVVAATSEARVGANDHAIASTLGHYRGGEGSEEEHTWALQGRGGERERGYLGTAGGGGGETALGRGGGVVRYLPVASPPPSLLSCCRAVIADDQHSASPHIWRTHTRAHSVPPPHLQ